ncbi:hypothetical protein BX600DRAFT_87690 [Xylariales sp. PMI_506]|nr:hypothetical protein BX600DRAFT_87690 [Xylariales sp. PMI_506]
MTAQMLPQNYPMSTQQDFISLDREKLDPVPGLPLSFDGPTTWSGYNDSLTEEDYIINLSPEDRFQFQAAVVHANGLGLNGDEVNIDRFPLQGLERKLALASEKVHHGPGICILRGLNPAEYTSEENAIGFLGLSSYIGEERGVQTSSGDIFVHVVDNPDWNNVPRSNRHGIHTNDSLPFHSDVGSDTLVLQVRQCAANGGKTCVASASTIYNELAASDPSTLQTLIDSNWPIRTGFKAYTLAPIIAFFKNRLLISMDPARLGPHASGCDEDAIPVLTLEQEKAIQTLQKMTNKHQVKLDTVSGDIIFINNWALLHAREPYMDTDTQVRHLLRMWVRNAQHGWEVPDSMRPLWDAAFGEEAKGRDHVYALEPPPKYKVSKYTNGTAAYFPSDLFEPAK